MTTKKDDTDHKHTTAQHVAHGLEAAAGGAAVGATVGMIAGPVGAAAGAAIGGVAAALAEAVAEADDERAAARDAELDDEIGVTSGEIGAPNLKHPPAKIGAFSAAAMGAGGGDETTPAEGPIQDIDGDLSDKRTREHANKHP